MAASGLQLLVQQGPRTGQVFELDKPVIIIGREAGSDIVLEDPQVSRHHARLTLQAGGYVVEDLGSTNGTYLNGRRVTSATPIKAGDALSLGDTIRLEVQGVEFGAGETVVGRPQQPTVPPMPPAPQPMAGPPMTPPPTTPPPMTPPPPPPSFGPPPSAGPSYVPPAPPPPPPATARKGPSCWVWGCGCLVLLIVFLIIAAFLVYQFAPPSVAAPICEVLNLIPGLGGLCQ